MTLPLWVASPPIRQLLNALVDRAEAAQVRGSERAQSLALVERTWPALHAAPFESDREALWAHVRTLAEWGWVELPPRCRRVDGYAFAPRIALRDEAAVREAVGRQERVRGPGELWREAVSAHLRAPEPIKETVRQFCVEVPGHSAAEVVQRLNGLAEIARESDLYLREVSARLFWGMSKVLDGRQALVAAVLGLADCPFPEAPVQLQVFLPPAGHGQGVLFVENQVTFERAVCSRAAAFEGLALAFASGFKGSAQRLRSRAGCSVYYAAQGALDRASTADFEGWLFDGLAGGRPVYFWGDLDYAGMSILAAMRAGFPSLRAWEPGYEPMCRALRQGLGHAPESADKAGQRRVSHTGCEFADLVLLPLLASTGKFVDQELRAWSAEPDREG